MCTRKTPSFNGDGWGWGRVGMGSNTRPRAALIQTDRALKVTFRYIDTCAFDTLTLDRLRGIIYPTAQ